MPVTYIPQYELDQARRRHLNVAASLPAKTEMRGGDGVVEMRMPVKAYLNAVHIHGHPLTDTEYWNDMKRMHPEIMVKYNSRKTMFAVGKKIGKEDFIVPRGQGKMTRFGRVNYHKTYF